MNAGLWILQALMALLFGMVGSAKLFQPIDRLAKRFPWMSKAPPQLIRFIGACELAGAVGLIAPQALSILPKLTLAAAVGLIALMGCATVFHVVRREIPAGVRAFIILLAVVVIALGRWTLAPI